MIFSTRDPHVLRGRFITHEATLSRTEVEVVIYLTRDGLAWKYVHTTVYNRDAASLPWTTTSVFKIPPRPGSIPESQMLVLIWGEIVSRIGFTRLPDGETPEEEALKPYAPAYWDRFPFFHALMQPPPNIDDREPRDMAEAVRWVRKGKALNCYEFGLLIGANPKVVDNMEHGNFRQCTEDQLLAVGYRAQEVGLTMAASYIFKYAFGEIIQSRKPKSEQEQLL